jgi:hypothetical protein
MLVFDARGKKRSEFTSDSTGRMLAFEHAGLATSRIASFFPFVCFDRILRQ